MCRENAHHVSGFAERVKRGKDSADLEAYALSLCKRDVLDAMEYCRIRCLKKIHSVTLIASKKSGAPAPLDTSTGEGTRDPQGGLAETKGVIEAKSYNL